MRKYYSVPLLFFLLAALLGLFLRWQFVHPTPGVRFTYFVHSHSHVMFLGWVFNVLFLSSIEDHIQLGRRRPYMRLFLFLQILVFAMMISFPIQGYGAFSIAFSTAHTLAVMIFIPIFFRHASGPPTVSRWFLKVAWIFFFLSTLGPFSLGYLMASGMGNTVWNNFSIYYYLHFQYNGFFLFGILSLFLRIIEQKNIPIEQARLKSIGQWMAFACVPAYFLSVLFAKPSAIFYWLGGIGAVVQLLALILFMTEMLRIRSHLRTYIKPLLLPIAYFIAGAFLFKSLLQVASAHPYVAELAFSLRPVVIAYLHLVLVGIISFFLLGWYIQKDLMHERLASTGLIALVTGFLGSEIILVLVPWWNTTMLANMPSGTLTFVFSIFMAGATVLFYIAFYSNLKKSESAHGREGQGHRRAAFPDKNQFWR